MILLYIIIGYLISVGLSIISDILLILLLGDNDDKKRLKNAETIGDFFKEISYGIYLPIVNIIFCVLFIFLILIKLVYKLYVYYISKINVLWDKFLNIKIRKNKQG